MAEVVGIASGIFAAGQALDIFARQIRNWRRLSDRLLDLNQGLTVSKHVFERWRQKWEINRDQPIVYLLAIFGREGCQNIRLTLSTIQTLSVSLQDDVDEIIGRALRFQSGRSAQSRLIDERLVEVCLQRIRQKTTWKQKFALSVWKRADSMETSLIRLQKALKALEHYTNYYLEKEHPEIFSEIRRLPGRNFVLRVGHGRADVVQGKVSDTLSSQKDAELLHRASNQNDKIHIGLSVPRIHRRDFAFLYPLGGRTREFLVQPVRIEDPRVPRHLAAAVPNLSQSQNPYDKCLVKPSSRSTNGFQLTVPPVKLLSDLEVKEPLSAIFKARNTRLGSQSLYPKDQNALASGIAQSCLRLIGSPWLRFLDNENVRWRRTTDGQWTSMLTATPGNRSTNNTLEACLAANKDRRDHRDLSKHIHIFRIGLVIAELCLKKSVSYIGFDRNTDGVKIYLDDDQGNSQEVDAHKIAAEVDLMCNPYLGNMVFFCLNVLQDKDRLSDKEIQGGYFNVVVRDAEDLDKIVRTPRRWGSRGVRSPGGSSAGGSL